MHWEPTHNRTVLDNGLTVVSEEIAHVRSVSIGVWVRCGSRHEDAATLGMAHFIEHMLFKGTATRSAFDIAAAIDSVGGVMNAATGKELTSFYIKIPDYHLPLAIELLADIINHSAFADAEIAREKSVVLQEIQLLEDSPDEYIHEVFEAAFWKGHPLGTPILGTQESIEGLNRESLLRFFTGKYRSDAVVLAAAGNIRHAQLLELVERSFGAMPAGAVRADGAAPEVKPALAVLPKDLEQTQIIIGTLGPSAVSGRRFAAFVLNSLLGGSMSSRLFQEIREQRGLAYAVNSYLASYQDTGMMGIYVGTGEETAPEVISLIQDNIAALADGGLTAREVRDAKELIKGNFLLSMESTDNRMSKLARNEICFGRYVPEEEIMAQIEAVREEDVRALVRELFRPATMSIAAMGRVQEKDIAAVWRYAS
jgi:predicted Zn-dependent peptidase